MNALFDAKFMERKQRKSRHTCETMQKKGDIIRIVFWVASTKGTTIV